MRISVEFLWIFLVVFTAGWLNLVKKKGRDMKKKLETVTFNKYSDRELSLKYLWLWLLLLMLFSIKYKHYNSINMFIEENI